MLYTCNYARTAAYTKSNDCSLCVKIVNSIMGKAGFLRQIFFFLTVQKYTCDITITIIGKLQIHDRLQTLGKSMFDLRSSFSYQIIV